MKPLLKDIIIGMISEKPRSTWEIAKAISSESTSAYMGSSVRCSVARLIKSGVVVRVGTDERGGAKYGLAPAGGTVVSEFQRLLAPLRQGRAA